MKKTDFEEEFEYGYECKSLKREEILKEQILESYRTKLINELLSGENPIIHEVIEKPKKSFWQKLWSII